MMKRFLLLFSFVLTIISCQQSETAVSNSSPIQIILVSTDFAVGQPRVAFALRDGPLAAEGVQAVELTVQLVATETAVSPQTIIPTRYDDYEVPYWVVYPDIPQAGFWGLTAEITLADGSVVQSPFTIQVNDKSLSPDVGTAAPPSQNRTLATEPDLNKLSSGENPNPALYQMTIAQAMASGQPTVVVFATPGLCQSAWCLPVLNSVEEVRAGVGEAANFIHVEVYEDFQTLTWVKEMQEWGLETEPWTFVLDQNGRIAAKLSGPLSPRELSTTLNPLLP